MLSEGTVIGPYTVGSLLRSDGVTELYQADTAKGPVLLKAGDVSNESVTLAMLRTDADARFLPYLPDFLGSALHGTEQINVFEEPEDFYTLAEVLDAYPEGLDPRDMAWMYRRLLVALGFAHQAGYIHGSVLPHTILINPEKHGLIVWDWVFAVQYDKSNLEESVGTYPGVDTSWYPPEVKHGVLTPATDIFMAAQVAIALIGGEVSRLAPPSWVAPEYKSFFTGSLKLSPEDRIQDAWKVLEYFDGLLERLYGPRKFRPFSMPKNPDRTT